MSLFKMFGGGGGRSKSDKSGISRDNAASNDGASKRAPPPAPAVAAEAGQEAMDPDEAEARAAAAQLDLPFRSGKKSRNLSISRSGRHKYRANKRASVVTGEVFGSSASTETAVNGGGGSAAGSSTPGGYCRDTQTPHGGAIAQTSMSRTPTAV